MSYIIAVVKNNLTGTILVLAFLIISCNTGPDPRDVLNRSHDAMREVQSYRFSGKVQTKTQDGVIGGRQSGQWAAPDRWYTKLEASGEFAGQVSETLAIDQRLFTRESDSQGGTWQEMTSLKEGLTAYNPRPETYLAIPGLENLQLQDDFIFNGTPTFQITGEQTETRTLPERFPPRPEGDEVLWVTTYTWLIAKEDYLLMRYAIEQDTGLGRATHWNTWDFHDYNQPVTIEIPQINEEN